MLESTIPENDIILVRYKIWAIYFVGNLVIDYPIFLYIECQLGKSGNSAL
jgi:hypothetical protein